MAGEGVKSLTGLFSDYTIPSQLSYNAWIAWISVSINNSPGHFTTYFLFFSKPNRVSQDLVDIEKKSHFFSLVHPVRKGNERLFYNFNWYDSVGTDLTDEATYQWAVVLTNMICYAYQYEVLRSSHNFFISFTLLPNPTHQCVYD